MFRFGLAVASLVLLWATTAKAVPLPELSETSRECISCHQTETPALYQQWGASKHFVGNVGCYECHRAVSGEDDAFDHNGTLIAASHHSKAGRILGSLDNRLAEVVEGNRGLVTPGFPHGNSAAAVNGCWQCHGSQVKTSTGRPAART